MDILFERIPLSQNFEYRASNGIGARFFSSFLLLRMMSLRYWMEIWERRSISLLTLVVGILRSMRFMITAL